MSFVFVDLVKIEVTGGRGGNGAASFRRELYIPRGGPDGGDGGHGGSVILKASTEVNSLLSFRYKRECRAQDAGHGHGANRHGKNGEDIILKVPVGTLVIDTVSNALIADLDKEGEQAVVARGGKGGRGNTRFANSVNRAPKGAEMGLPGDHRELSLELKLMADVGLIGFPNAGKSTLLSVVSAATPKIADFPFTTLVPNLGVVQVPNSADTFVAADIPGLIEGASEGKGLGVQFLRHIERTRVLIHVIDGASTEGRNPLEDYSQVNKELEQFNPALAQLPQIIALNKLDILADPSDLIDRFRCFTEREIFLISAATKKGINELLWRANDLLKTIPQTTIVEDKFKAFVLEPEKEPGIYIVRRDDGAYVVTGRRVEILAAKTNFENEDSLRNFFKMAKRMGVYDMLRSQGVVPGDTVVFAGHEFDYE